MGINKVHIVQLLKKKMNTSLYLVVQIWTSIRKKEEQVIIMFDAGDGLAEVKRRSTEILETWFNFHFSFNVIKQLQSFVSVNTSFYGPYKSISFLRSIKTCIDLNKRL